MRLVVLSDVHGNLPALEAVLDDVRQYSPDGFVIAGDLVGAPCMNETFEIFRKLNAWIIRGNTDNNILRYESSDLPEVWSTNPQFGLYRAAHHHLSRINLDYLKSLPEQLTVTLKDTAPIRVVHGSPRDPTEGIYPDRNLEAIDQALAQTTEPVLVCGHTHIPWKLLKEGRLVFNPGAVCMALNGNICAQYAILTWSGNHWQVEHRAVAYDHKRLRRTFKESGMLDEGGPMVRAFFLSIENGAAVGEHLLRHAQRLALEAGFKDNEIIPDPVWEQVVISFNWSEFFHHERRGRAGDRTKCINNY
jgi:predicted phosphodiesterase